MAPKKTSIKESLIDEAVDCALSSTSHGIPNILRNKRKPIKFIWIICFLVATGVCIYSIIVSITSYFEFNYATNIQKVFQNPIKFPAITICNQNAFTTKAAIAYVQSYLNSSGIESVRSPILAKLVPYEPNQVTANLLVLGRVLKQMAAANNDSFRRAMSLDLNEFVLAATFAETPQDYELFSWIYSQEFGNCYQFNVGKTRNGSRAELLTTTKSGFTNGLSLLVYAGVPSHIDTLSYNAGAVLFVHDQNDSINSANSIALSAGALTNVAVRKQVNERLALPYNQCYNNEQLSGEEPATFDSAYYRRTLQLNFTYSQIECLKVAEQTEYALHCNCTEAYYSTLLNSVPCSRLADLYCCNQVHKSIHASASSASSSKFLTFLALCPVSCSGDSYSYATAQSSFPTASYATLLLNESKMISILTSQDKALTVESVSESLLWLNVIYE